MRTALTTLVSTLLITLLLLGSVPSSKAVSEAPQVEWSKTYGAGNGHSIVQTADGGFVVTGSLNAAWLAKFAPESATPPDSEAPQFSTMLIVVVVVVVVADSGAGLLVYLKKRARKAER